MIPQPLDLQVFDRTHKQQIMEVTMLIDLLTKGPWNTEKYLI